MQFIRRGRIQNKVVVAFCARFFGVMWLGTLAPRSQNVMPVCEHRTDEALPMAKAATSAAAQTVLLSDVRYPNCIARNETRFEHVYLVTTQ